MREESKDHIAIAGIKRHYFSICWLFFQEINENSEERIKLEVVKGKSRICINDEQTEEMTEWLRRLRESIDYSKLTDSGIYSAALCCELSYYRIAVRMFLDGWSHETEETHTDEWDVLTNMVNPLRIFCDAMKEARSD